MKIKSFIEEEEVSMDFYFIFEAVFEGFEKKCKIKILNKKN